LRGALATKQSSGLRGKLDCFADARNDDMKNRSRDALPRPSFAHHRAKGKTRLQTKRQTRACEKR
jgi:hypothetical protein